MSSWRRHSRVISGVFVGGPDGAGSVRVFVSTRRTRSPIRRSRTPAAAQAQAEEVQNLVRLADAAMTGQQVPSDFPIQFQNDFLKAQNARVWVPITLTIDSSKLTTGALTLYLRVAPRGHECAPAAGARRRDPKTDPKKNDKKKDAKPAAAGAARIRSRTSRSSS